MQILKILYEDKTNLNLNVLEANIPPGSISRNLIEVRFMPEHSGVYTGTITIVTEDVRINVVYCAIVAGEALRFQQRQILLQPDTVFPIKVSLYNKFEAIVEV